MLDSIIMPFLPLLILSVAGTILAWMKIYRVVKNAPKDFNSRNVVLLYALTSTKAYCLILSIFFLPVETISERGMVILSILGLVFFLVAILQGTIISKDFPKFLKDGDEKIYSKILFKCMILEFFAIIPFAMIFIGKIIPLA